jgi:hypothetical protein
MNGTVARCPGWLNEEQPKDGKTEHSYHRRLDHWYLGVERDIFNDRGARPPNNRVTPESAGYTEHRTFRPNGQVEFYKDGKLIGTDTYRIEPSGVPAREAQRYGLFFGEKK